MFEKTLADKFTTVFQPTWVRYDQPGESHEQDVLFIEVDNCKSTFKDGRIFCKITGKASMFSQAEKLPFAYFSKAIAQHPDETKDLFFYDFEENTRLFQNIVQRGFSFVYLFNSQYDPATGSITTITLSEVDP